LQGLGKGLYIIWPFRIYFGHLVHLWPFGNLVAIWYISPHFGILCREKSGNPVGQWFKGGLVGTLRQQSRS
jgi:hypothetical protein